MQLVVSPMAGVTDSPFRELAIRNGADYGISEMITSQTHLWDSNKTRQRLKNSAAGKSKSIIQIAGASPDVIAEATVACSKLNFLDAIEINMGCPAKKVCNVLAGSALLRDSKLVENILYAAVNSVQTPIFLKTRLGWDHDNRNITDIALIAENSGIKSLAIHGRTRADMYNGEASYDLIAKVKKLVSIPVFANGDINTPEKAAMVIDLINPDGLYIGRGALGKPWLFQQVKDYLAYGKYYQVDDINCLVELILQHIQAIHEHYGEVQGVRFARKHFKWYLEANTVFFDNQHKSIFQRFSQIESADLQLEYITNIRHQNHSQIFFI